MRLIDADALERVLMSMPEEELCTDCCYNVIAKIDEAPTIDPEKIIKRKIRGADGKYTEVTWYAD